MSTRSIVYARTESGIKGIYVHWDGYHEGRLNVLQELIARDGVSRVVSTLFSRPSGWSHLTTEQGNELREFENDGRFEAVPGYGVQYTDTEFDDPFNPGQKMRQGNDKYSTTDVVDRHLWIEYVYVIEHDGSISWAENIEKPWDELDWNLSAMAYTDME